METTKSFVNEGPIENAHDKNKFDIVVAVINARLEEKKAKEKAKANKEKKERILGILADKQDEALKSKSAEELEKLLAEL